MRNEVNEAVKGAINDALDDIEYTVSEVVTAIKSGLEELEAGNISEVESALNNVLDDLEKLSKQLY